MTVMGKMGRWWCPRGCPDAHFLLCPSFRGFIHPGTDACELIENSTKYRVEGSEYSVYHTLDTSNFKFSIVLPMGAWGLRMGL
jgi:hypothetical protein